MQALNIPTKINKGTVEITTDVQLIKIGEKVGASEATLLAKLGIKPFSYGLVIRQARCLPHMFAMPVVCICCKELVCGTPQPKLAFAVSQSHAFAVSQSHAIIETAGARHGFRTGC